VKEGNKEDGSEEDEVCGGSQGEGWDSVASVVEKKQEDRRECGGCGDEPRCVRIE
jgi:polyferredoxin